jgi:cysteine desulfurase/selenocysteine lyase
MNNIDLRSAVVGTNTTVPVIGGGRKRYINFDNAASTPPLKNVWESLRKFKDYYSSVHRGTGYKSIVSTRAYDNAHSRALKFVGADPDHFTAILVKNSTDGINKLARRLPLKPGDIVLSSLMEHHSNDLPWRAVARTEYIEIDDSGFLDMDDLRRKLAKFGKKVKLVTVSGASNVTGIIPPVKEIARLAHRAGAEFLLDAAQLAPHRKIRMGKPGGDDSVDYLVLSAHKMYAPFGSGVLVGPREVFRQGDPDTVGGGTVNYVTLNEVRWAHLPDKEEAGSPNVPGAVALSSAIDFFESVGFSRIASHEKDLTRYALKRFSEYPQIRLYGPSKWIPRSDRVGAISFNIDGFYHAETAAILSYEGAIAVRNGCFCAHPYIQRLLKITDGEATVYRDQIAAGDRSRVPGMVRISFGLYNTRREIDRFFDLMDIIVAGKYKGNYILDRHSGEVCPEGFTFDGMPRF